MRRLQGEIEMLKSTGSKGDMKIKALEINVKELRKELQRSKAQLEGVVDQSAKVQINIKRYYEGEIRDLREELESLGVHVQEKIRRTATTSPENVAKEGDNYINKGGSQQNENDDAEEEIFERHACTSPLNVSAEDSPVKSEEPKGIFKTFFNLGRETEREKREKRLSDALGLIPG